MKIREEALYGLFGDIVKAVDPHTESSPLAVLVQLVVIVGNVVGRSAYYRVEATKHFANTSIVLVGPTATGRKGTSFGYVRAMAEKTDQIYVKNRIVSGLSSGEGVIAFVQDAGESQTDCNRSAPPVIQSGIRDKRMLVMDAEFANTLKVMNRSGNTLSTILRNAWDGTCIEARTKKESIRCQEPHISIIGNITEEELGSLLTSAEINNGFGNRILFFRVDRSKSLPHGGKFLSSPKFQSLVERLEAAVRFGKATGEVTMAESAKQFWESIYEGVSAATPGIVGALSARAAPHIIRIAMIYALVDQRTQIEREHLAAAYGLWLHSYESLFEIFGKALGNRVADDLLPELRERQDGMTRTEIRDFFKKNKSQNEIEIGLKLLREHGLAEFVLIPSGGRPLERWFATKNKAGKYDQGDLNDEISERDHEPVLYS
ncbi:MAG: DUF3987 domain-containing protein [Pseudobdellovibrionaceae bacterium]|nr:DUF3987 domain-containing protein [Bdellovibrionales bacterium]USN47108.1 MAG: DUF3987 domain-containing protein [Pseudobdellovibrionaceae bacterium]